jgi:hypothetical protein
MFSSKPRLAALEHNQSYQDASPSIHFSECQGPAVTSSGIMLTVFTRLRLASDGGRPTMLVLRRGVSADAQVKPSFGVGSSV